VPFRSAEVKPISAADAAPIPPFQYEYVPVFVSPAAFAASCEIHAAPFASVSASATRPTSAATTTGEAFATPLSCSSTISRARSTAPSISPARSSRAIERASEYRSARERRSARSASAVERAAPEVFRVLSFHAASFSTISPRPSASEPRAAAPIEDCEEAVASTCAIESMESPICETIRESLSRSSRCCDGT
jgi:hypothetical protein